MGDSFEYGNILFLGLVAVFIALRLRSVLGRGNGAEPKDVWRQATRDLPVDKPTPFLAPIKKAAPVEEETVPPTLQSNKPVADGLKAIKASDATFSTTDFLNGAKLAFEWVVQAFSAGDKDKLKALLSPERYQHFADEINARAGDGSVQETTLVSVLATDITEASCEKSRAQVTVQFTTEQIHVTRAKDKTILSGDPSAIERVIDVWTFERDTGSRDPNWKIVAT